MIAAPTDSYDERTCIVSSLTSLKMLMLSFDTAMDTLLESTNELDERITSLHERTQKRIEILSTKQQSQDRIGILLMAPSTYPSTPNNDRHNVLSIRKVKSACQKRQLEEQANAIPYQVKNSMISDSWLDRASAFEERQACFEALATNVMPSLISPSLNEEELRLSMPFMDPFNHHSNNTNIHSKEHKLQEQDVCSTTSASTTRTTGTARERWNYHKYKKNQQLKIMRRHNQHEQQKSSPRKKVSSFRQEAMKGSLPYLCDVLHDTYSSIEEQQNPPRHVVKLLHVKQQNQEFSYTPFGQSRSTQNTIYPEESNNHDNDEKELETTTTVSIPTIPKNDHRDLKLPVLIDKHWNGHVSLPENLPL